MWYLLIKSSCYFFSKITVAPSTYGKFRFLFCRFFGVKPILCVDIFEYLCSISNNNISMSKLIYTSCLFFEENFTFLLCARKRRKKKIASRVWK